MLPRNPPSRTARPLTTAEHELEAALLQGYIDQRRAAGHREKSISGNVAGIHAFRNFTGGPPWDWTPEFFDAYSAALPKAGNSALRIRGKQWAVKGYLALATDDAYGWKEHFARLNVCVRQIVRRSNSLPHHRNAARGKRRHLTAAEQMSLFGWAYLDMIKPKAREIDQLAAQVKYAALAIALTFAPRARELVLADYPAHTPPASGLTREFSPVDGLDIWHGKAYKGGEERGRFVPAIALFANQLEILDWYLTDVRPRLVRPHSPPALLLTTTGARFDSSTLSMYFRSMANAAGLPSELTFHCLRHTFATTLYLNGFEIEVIRQLLGHELQSTTMIYVHADTPFIQQRLLDHNTRLQRERLTRREDDDEQP